MNTSQERCNQTCYAMFGRPALFVKGTQRRKGSEGAGRWEKGLGGGKMSLNNPEQNKAVE